MTFSVGLNFVLTLLISEEKILFFTVACFSQMNALSAKMVHLIEITNHPHWNWNVWCGIFGDILVEELRRRIMQVCQIPPITQYRRCRQCLEQHRGNFEQLE
jgi:hypothetical protein